MRSPTSLENSFITPYVRSCNALFNWLEMWIHESFFPFSLHTTGSSLQCYRCSGDLQQCHGGAVTDNCPIGHDSCSSIVMNSASGMQFFFGCANENDCKAARSVCWKYMKDNPGVSCNATCCGSKECVQPYPKGEYRRFQIISSK